jgi:hypothetical protein
MINDKNQPALKPKLRSHFLELSGELKAMLVEDDGRWQKRRLAGCAFVVFVLFGGYVCSSLCALELN